MKINFMLNQFKLSVKNYNIKFQRLQGFRKKINNKNKKLQQFNVNSILRKPTHDFEFDYNFFNFFLILFGSDLFCNQYFFVNYWFYCNFAVYQNSNSKFKTIWNNKFQNQLKLIVAPSTISSSQKSKFDLLIGYQINDSNSVLLVDIKEKNTMRVFGENVYRNVAPDTLRNALKTRGQL